MEMDFDPGTRIVPFNGPRGTWIEHSIKINIWDVQVKQAVQVNVPRMHPVQDTS